jgi:hypothetical protein
MGTFFAWFAIMGQRSRLMSNVAAVRYFRLQPSLCAPAKMCLHNDITRQVYTAVSSDRLNSRVIYLSRLSVVLHSLCVRMFRSLRDDRLDDAEAFDGVIGLLSLTR